MSPILTVLGNEADVINARAMGGERGRVSYIRKLFMEIIETIGHTKICCGNDLATCRTPPGIQGRMDSKEHWAPSQRSTTYRPKHGVYFSRITYRGV